MKTPKNGYAVDKEALALSLPWLEQEIALFPNVQVIMLMGDVAKKMHNAIARKTDRKNPIPSGATYRLRQTAFYRGSVRIMPSYIMTGGNILIEKSKVTMAAEDVARMAEILRI